MKLLVVIAELTLVAWCPTGHPEPEDANHHRETIHQYGSPKEGAQC